MMQIALIALMGFATLQAQAAPAPLTAADFQTTQEDAEFAQLAQGLNLEDTAFELKYKDSGTSVGMKIKRAGEKVGKWVPPNSATNVEAQVASYHLGRFLGMSDLVVPSAYYEIRGRAHAEFKAMLQRASERNRWRKQNRDANLARLNASAKLMGVFTPDVDNKEVLDLALPARNTINSSHPIAKAIKAGGSMPSATKMITLKGVKTPSGRLPEATELELSRQFSMIMVLDLLNGQWDRWSGGNVEATWDEARNAVRFFARDNGGASMTGTSHVQKYLGIVSRFDAAQIERVKRLVELLKADPGSVATSLQMTTNPRSVLARAEALLTHVKSTEQRYGPAATFFPN